MIDPSFLLISTQRCGTTLMQCILNQHPKLALTGEAHWLPDVFSGGIWFQRMFETTYEDKHTLKDTSKWYKSVRLLITSLFPENHEKNWGLQLIGKNNADIADNIFKLYPSIKIIFLIRDPRDIYVSYIRTGIGGKQGGETLNLFREKMISLNLSYLTIRYEDIVTIPVETIQKICNYLKVPYEHSMLHPLSQKISRNETPALNSKSIHECSPKGNSSLIERWKTQLQADELLLMNSEAFFIKQLGYPIIQKTSLTLNHNISEYVSGKLFGMTESGTNNTDFSKKLPLKVDVYCSGAVGILFNKTINSANIKLKPFGLLKQNDYLGSRMYYLSISRNQNTTAVNSISSPALSNKTIHTITSLYRIYHLKKIWLYSAGGATRSLLENWLHEKLKVIGIIDTYKTGILLVNNHSYKIHGLKKALNYEFDAIIIPSEAYYEEIKVMLIGKGLTEKKHFFKISMNSTF